MAVMRLSQGALVVSNPTKEMKEALQYFHRTGSGGAYEDFFTMSEDGKSLVTLPGFAKRLRDAEGRVKFIDERIPMPDPNCHLAQEVLAGFPDIWQGTVLDAIRFGGGIISAPSVIGRAKIVAAILRAYPQEALIDRGTPLSVVTSDRDSAKDLAYDLSELLPGRQVCCYSNGTTFPDGDDVIVTTPRLLKDIGGRVGVYVATDAIRHTVDIEMVKAVSSIRDAARWLVCADSLGGEMEVDMVTEGLFGTDVFSMDYADAVRLGAAVPVVVCWVPSPAPHAYLGSYPFELLEKIATERNDALVSILGRLLSETQKRVVCCATSPAMVERVVEKAGVPVAATYEKMPVVKRKKALCDIAGGRSRCAVCTLDAIPSVEAKWDVVVLATCRGREACQRLPIRKMRNPGDRLWVVTFSHDWDMHNGRPGYLVRNDNARKRRFAELGFRQMSVKNVGELPFVGG